MFSLVEHSDSHIIRVVALEAMALPTLQKHEVNATLGDSVQKSHEW